MTSNESMRATYAWYIQQGKDLAPLTKRFSAKYKAALEGRKGRQLGGNRRKSKKIYGNRRDPLAGLTGEKRKKVENLLRDGGERWSF